MSTLNISEKFAVNILQELWSQRESYESEKFCDIVLIAGSDETRVPAHSCVLSAASEYFHGMFMVPMRESTTKEVKIPSVDCDILQTIVQYCYSGVVPDCEDRVVEVLETAEMLLLRDVVKTCADILAEKLHPSNCLGFALLAEQYRCEALLKKAKDYSLENFMAVIETDEFLELNAKEFREFLTSDNLTVSSEEDVFNGLKNWIGHNPAEREKYKAEMLKLVRLPLLGEEFLMEQVKPMCASPECQEIYTEALEQISPHYEKFNEIKSVQPRKLYQLLMAISKDNTKMHIQYYCPQRLSWMKWMKDLEYRWFPGVAITEDDLFFVGGALNDNIPINTVTCLNLKTLNLKEVGPMMEHRVGCKAVVLNGVLYAVGGKNKDGGVLSSVEKWNANTNTWSKVASMTVNRCFFGLAVLNGKLYAVGGVSCDNIEVNSAECYASHLNLWISIASMHETRYLFSLAVSNRLLYALGGFEGITTVERYNPKTNSWTKLCSLNDTLGRYPTYAGLCTTFRGKVVVGYKDRIEEYNDETNEWIANASLKVFHNFHLLFTYEPSILKVA